MPSTSRMIARGCVKHCPRCGAGGLFRWWFKMRSACPRCGLPFARIDGHWTGDIGINTIVSFTVLLLAIVVGILVSYPDPPGVWLFGVAGGVALVFPILFHPFSKTIWLAIDVAMRPDEPDARSARATEPVQPYNRV